MTPEQNPPKDPSLAETKVLPRFPGYREMDADEVLHVGDMVKPLGSDYLVPTICAGEKVDQEGVGHYFRPIAPTPPAPRMLSQIPQDELFALHKACLNHDAAPQATEPKADPESTSPAAFAPDSLKVMYRTNGESSWWAVLDIPRVNELHDGDEFTYRLASPWMADSCPLLAEIEKLSADRDAADKSLKAFVELEMEVRRERDAARAQVQALMEAASQAREALKGIISGCEGYHVSHHSTGWGSERAEAQSEVADEIADNARAALASLVSIIQPDGGKA